MVFWTKCLTYTNLPFSQIWGYWQVTTTDAFTVPEEILMETLHFSGCWLFLKKRNNEIIVINITPPFYFNCPIEVYPPTNLRKNFVPTKFWQIFKLSPPIIMWVGQKPWFNCLWDTEPLQGDSFLCVTKFQDFLIFIWLTKEGSKSESAWSHAVFLNLRTLVGNPVPKPLDHCLWSKGSWCYI